jgi:hypothetical protein
VQSEAAPQRFRSVAGSTQRPPQTRSPPRHAVAALPQAPPLHTCPAAQTAPPVQSAAAPQCAGSLRASTQVPAQTAKPVGQESAQLPAAQSSPAPHATPFAQVVAPQWLRLDDGSTQLPAQASRPGGQFAAQVPPVQTVPAAQVTPPEQSGRSPHDHGSVSGSMHQLEHITCPAGQPTTCATQVPALQTWLAPQVVPALQSALAPQYSGLTRGSTQVPPQAARPGAQVGAQAPFEQTIPGPQAAPVAQVVAPQ